jgi:hypothetical protein
MAETRNNPFPEFPDTILTTKMQKEICDALEILVPFKYATGAAGVSVTQALHWIELGRSGGAQHFVAFAEAVQRAQDRAVQNMHVKALQGGKGSQQATWFLERLKREEYGPVQKIEHSGSIDDLGRMTDDDLIAERAERLRKLRAAGTGDLETGVPEESQLLGD